MEEQWYVYKNNNVEGPFGKKEIHGMLDRDEIKNNTRAWSKEVGEWKPLSQIECFTKGMPMPEENPLNENINKGLAPPFSFADANEEAESKHYRDTERKTIEIETELNQARPWVRYFAKFTDIFFFANLFSLLLVLVSLEGYIFLYSYEFVAGLIVLLLYNFFEAFMLSMWGTTIGKWLLGTYVKDMSGNNLSYSAALTRSFRIYAQGLGLGIPIISFITLIVSYNSLTSSEFGKTNWDIMGGHSVEHKKLNPLKIFGLVLLWALFAWSLGE